MPHDLNGEALKPGDLVYVPCIVKSVQENTDYCNVSLETVEPMHPGTHKTCITANAKQVIKQ